MHFCTCTATHPQLAREHCAVGVLVGESGWGGEQHLAGVVVLAVHGRSSEHEVKQRRVEHLRHLVARPVCAHHPQVGLPCRLLRRRRGQRPRARGAQRLREPSTRRVSREHRERARAVSAADPAARSGECQVGFGDRASTTGGPRRVHQQGSHPPWFLRGQEPPGAGGVTISSDWGILLPLTQSTEHPSLPCGRCEIRQVERLAWIWVAGRMCVTRVACPPPIKASLTACPAQQTREAPMNDMIAAALEHSPNRCSTARGMHDCDAYPHRPVHRRERPPPTPPHSSPSRGRTARGLPRGALGRTVRPGATEFLARFSMWFSLLV